MTSSPLRRLPAIGAIAIATTLAAAACGGGGTGTANPSGDAAADVQLVEEGKVKTCTSLPYPPFQFDESGKTVGFDVDMIDLVAKKLNAKQEIVDIKFDLIKSGAALNSNRCDVAAAGMTITPERQKVMDFSAPYFDETLVVIAKKDQAVMTLADVKSKNLKLGVQVGTTSLDKAKEEGINATEFDDAGKQQAALKAGRVDVVLQDLPTVNEWLKKDTQFASDFQLGDKIDTGSQYGFSVRKGNTAMLKAIDDVLKTAVSDGTWAKSYEKWIGSKPETTPAPK